MSEPVPIDELAAASVEMRQQKARQFLAGMTEQGLSLCIDQSDLHYLWDTMGRTYLDLTSGGGALPMGAYHAVTNAIWADPKASFPYVSRYGATCLQVQVDYAQAISERMPLVDGEHQQVLFTGSGKQAMFAAANLAKENSVSWANIKPIDERSFTPMDTGAAQRLCEMTADRGHVIVVDERITGYGRLGAFRAATRYDLDPWAANILTVFGEAGGGGIPFGAVVGPRKLMERFSPHHASTNFGGNPIACSAGLRILEIQDGIFYDHVRDLSHVFEVACESLRSQFSGVITSHTGRGLAAALTIDASVDMELLNAALLNNGILVETNWDHVLLRPPLIMNEAGIGQAFDQIAAGFVDAIAASPVIT